MGSQRVYLGGWGNLPWGCRHWGRVLGHLKGPTCWNLPTCTVGRWSLRGGGDGGDRALLLPLPPGWGGEFNGKPLPLAMPGHVIGVLCVKPWGSIPALPRGTSGEEDP